MHYSFHTVSQTCPANKLQCTNGACVEANYRCHYGFDNFGFPLGCRDAAHLKNCGKDYMFGSLHTLNFMMSLVNFPYTA